MKTKNEVQSKNVKTNVKFNLVELSKEQQKEIIGGGKWILVTENGEKVIKWVE